jgi:hypothetical protein
MQNHKGDNHANQHKHGHYHEPQSNRNKNLHGHQFTDLCITAQGDNVGGMARLKDRYKQIPNGLRFRCAPLKYQSNNWHSFDKIVSDVWARIRSNPHLARKHNLPDNRAGVEDMVDAYNALVCEQNGWLDYIQSGDQNDAGPPPKFLARNPTLLQKVGGRNVAGIKALLQWLGEGGEPVKPELSEARAAVCAKCPLNRKMELKDFFVQSASELIRRQIEFARDCGLQTSEDDNLGICSACGCPIKLMVHIPLKHKLSSMTQQMFDELDAGCWVRAEKAAIDNQPLMKTLDTFRI